MQLSLTVFVTLNILIVFHSITFRELHTAYGRPILTDRNEWRHRQKQEQDKKEVPLITL